MPCSRLLHLGGLKPEGEEPPSLPAPAPSWGRSTSFSLCTLVTILLSYFSLPAEEASLSGKNPPQWAPPPCPSTQPVLQEPGLGPSVSFLPSACLLAELQGCDPATKWLLSL